MNQVARLGDYQPPKPEEPENAETVDPVASAEAAPELAPPSAPTASDETVAPPQPLAEQGAPELPEASELQPKRDR